PRATYVSRTSDCAHRAERIRHDASDASPSVSSHRVVLPMPTTPSMSATPKPSCAPARNAASSTRSSARPIMPHLFFAAPPILVYRVDRFSQSLLTGTANVLTDAVHCQSRDPYCVGPWTSTTHGYSGVFPSETGANGSR